MLTGLSCPTQSRTSFNRVRWVIKGSRYLHFFCLQFGNSLGNLGCKIKTHATTLQALIYAESDVWHQKGTFSPASHTIWCVKSSLCDIFSPVTRRDLGDPMLIVTSISGMQSFSGLKFLSKIIRYKKLFSNQRIHVASNFHSKSPRCYNQSCQSVGEFRELSVVVPWKNGMKWYN